MTLRPLAFAICILGFAASTYAQAVASQPGTKDPQAVALLTQSLNAAGGLSVISSVQDFTGTGTITYNWAGEPVQAPVTVRGMGVSNFRLDASLPSGTRTLAVGGYTGVLVAPEGTKTSLGYYNLATAGSMTIPNVRIAAALSDTTTSISYLGAVTFNGGQAIQIHFAANDPNFAGVTSLSTSGTFDLYVDPTSSLVIALTETGHSDTNFTTVYMHELDFSNYQSSGNVVVPYSITEKVGGQATWSITLNSVSFNSGLTDSMFTP